MVQWVGHRSLQPDVQCLIPGGSQWCQLLVCHINALVCWPVRNLEIKKQVTPKFLTKCHIHRVSRLNKCEVFNPLSLCLQVFIASDDIFIDSNLLRVDAS